MCRSLNNLMMVVLDNTSPILHGVPDDTEDDNTVYKIPPVDLTLPVIVPYTRPLSDTEDDNTVYKIPPVDLTLPVIVPYTRPLSEPLRHTGTLPMRVAPNFTLSRLTKRIFPSTKNHETHIMSGRGRLSRSI